MRSLPDSRVACCQRAKTFASRVYEYNAPDVQSVAHPIQLEMTARRARKNISGGVASEIRLTLRKIGTMRPSIDSAGRSVIPAKIRQESHLKAGVLPEIQGLDAQ